MNVDDDGRDDRQSAPDRATREKYERDLIARDQAARAEDGELPRHATHEIVEDPADPEKPKLRRRRFRLF